MYKIGIREGTTKIFKLYYKYWWSNLSDTNHTYSIWLYITVSTAIHVTYVKFLFELIFIKVSIKVVTQNF